MQASPSRVARRLPARRAPRQLRDVGAVGGSQPGLQVAMAMYDHQAGNADAVFPATTAELPEIISLGQLEAMLRIRDASTRASSSACWPTAASGRRPRSW